MINIKKYFYGLSIFAALVILTDFVLPGDEFKEGIIEIRKEREQYYNAARNYHFSYSVFTKNHQFSIAEDFVKKIQVNQEIEYTVSRIFKEVNSYKLPSAESNETYSLRLLTGLILPLLVLITMGFAFKYEDKIGTLVFVVQVLLIADLVLLIY